MSTSEAAGLSQVNGLVQAKIEDDKGELVECLGTMKLTPFVDNIVKEEVDLDLKFAGPPCIKIEFDGSLEDFRIGNGIAVEGDGELGIDVDPCGVVNLPGTSLDTNVESLDSGEVRDDTEIGEEEALLLAEVAMAGQGGIDRETGVSSLQSPSVDSGDCSSVDKKEEQISSDQSGKGCKNSTSGRRKVKVDWTPELHRRFVQAVEQLGVEKAIPSRILELMGVQCLTRHNIASHLQKYRSHRRHLLAREAEASAWHHRRPLTPGPWPRTRRDGSSWLTPLHSNSPPIQPRPPLGLAPMQPHLSSHGHQVSPPLVVWGHPTVDHSSMHMWQQPAMSGLAVWQAPDGSYWQHPAACLDTWCHPSAAPVTPCYPYPLMRVPLATMPVGSQMVAPSASGDSFLADESMPLPLYHTNSDDSDIGVAAGAAASSKPSDFHPPKEILDAAISEALANPWTPPPLGLKPPSMEGVMAELYRQGINTVPPSTS